MACDHRAERRCWLLFNVTGRPASRRDAAWCTRTVRPNALVRFTAPFNLSRNPTLSLPCAQSADGPPPSLQFVGKHLGEAMLIQAGAAQETPTAWHDQHPDLTRFS
jgi:amidase